MDKFLTRRLGPVSPKSSPNPYTPPFTVHTEKTVAESWQSRFRISFSSCSTTPPFLPNSGLATSSGPLDQVIPRTQKPQSILHNSHHADSTPKAVNSRTGWSVFLMKIEERIQMHIICQHYNGKRGLYTSAPTAAKSRPTWEPISGCEYLVMNNGKGGPPKKYSSSETQMEIGPSSEQIQWYHCWQKSHHSFRRSILMKRLFWTLFLMMLSSSLVVLVSVRKQ